MCQMSKKLPAKFYQNRPHTLDQIVATHSNEKPSQTLSPNVKVMAMPTESVHRISPY